MEFSIIRTIGGEEQSISLTEEELQDIHCTLRKEDEREYLIDEIYDLDDNDDCFNGCDRDKLIENGEFLSAVDALWDKYNGHGGDRTENLREAIDVITSQKLRAGF